MLTDCETGLQHKPAAKADQADGDIQMADKECYGFKMYPSYYEVIRPLPDDQRLAMLDAIMDYAFMGTEPNGLSPILNGYFTLIRPNIDKSVRQCNASVNNGGKGGRPPKQKEETQQKPRENPEETQQKPGRKADRDRDREEIGNTEIDNIPPVSPKGERERFKPPTLEEVRAYHAEKGYSFDPENFVDYYISNGWKVGKNPMKDWKAALRNWAKNEGDNGNAQPKEHAKPLKMVRDENGKLVTLRE